MQPSQQYFAHIVLDVEESWYHNEPKYWIGNIQRHFNGWCLREHINNFLVDVQVWWYGDGQYHSRPLPKTVFAEVEAEGLQAATASWGLHCCIGRTFIARAKKNKR